MEERGRKKKNKSYGYDSTDTTRDDRMKNHHEEKFSDGFDV